MSTDRLHLRLYLGPHVVEDRVLTVERLLRIGDERTADVAVEGLSATVWRGKDGQLRVSGQVLRYDAPTMLTSGELRCELTLQAPAPASLPAWVESPWLPDLRLGLLTAAIVLAFGTFDALCDFVERDPVVQADLARLLGWAGQGTPDDAPADAVGADPESWPAVRYHGQ